MAFLFALSLIPTAVQIGMELGDKQEAKLTPEERAAMEEDYAAINAENQYQYALDRERDSQYYAAKENRKKGEILYKQKSASDEVTRQHNIKQQELRKNEQQAMATKQLVAQQMTSRAVSAGEAQKKAMEEQKLQLQRKSAQQSDAFKRQLAQQKAFQEASIKALSSKNVQPVAQPRRVRPATRTGGSYDAETLNVLRAYYGVSLSDAKKIYKAYLT